MRPPLSPGSSSPRVKGGAVDAIDREILGEKAASLGRAAERVQRTLDILRGSKEAGEARLPVLRDAADAVQAYFVQREICGLRRHESVIAELGIPQEVLVRLGVR